MRADTRAMVLGAGCCALVIGGLCGCAGSNAPRSWLPYAEEAQQEGFGGWIEVECGKATNAVPLSGELLAVSNDSVLVLTSTGVGACALTNVEHAKLEGYDPRSGTAASMVLVGTIGSVTVGWGVVLMAPLWVIVGSTATGALSDDGQLNIHASQRSDGSHADAARRTWKDMRLFARFPQGLPAGIDRSQLHMRPLHYREVRNKRTRAGSIVGD